MKKGWHLTFNAPVTIVFSIICALILLLNQFVFGGHLINTLFTAPGSQKSDFAFNWKSVLDYIRLLTYVFGHADWPHLLGNLAFILLLGPLMEERYGSAMLALMMVVTAFVTGVINACLIPKSLVGSSSIVFMLIMLSSLVNIEKKEIPLTFILVFALYIGTQFINSAASNERNVAAFAHIAGGLCGSLFGFMAAPKTRTARKSSKKTDTEARLREIDSQSPRFKRDNSDEDVTQVGTIEL